MPEFCKDCKHYSIDADTVGLCLNSISVEFGRLVWPSKTSCDVGEEKTIPMDSSETSDSDLKRII